MNRPIAEVGRADEGEAGQIAAGQVQPEPCGETQERGRGRHQKPRRSLAQPLHAEQINRVRLERMEKTRHQVSSLADRLVCPAKLRMNPEVPAQLVQTWVLSAGGLQCAQCRILCMRAHRITQSKSLSLRQRPFCTMAYCRNTEITTFWRRKTCAKPRSHRQTGWARSSQLQAGSGVVTDPFPGKVTRLPSFGR